MRPDDPQDLESALAAYRRLPRAEPSAALDAAIQARARAGGGDAIAAALAGPVRHRRDPGARREPRLADVARWLGATGAPGAPGSGAWRLPRR